MPEIQLPQPAVDFASLQQQEAKSGIQLLKNRQLFLHWCITNWSQNWNNSKNYVKRSFYIHVNEINRRGSCCQEKGAGSVSWGLGACAANSPLSVFSLLVSRCVRRANLVTASSQVSKCPVCMSILSALKQKEPNLREQDKNKVTSPIHLIFLSCSSADFSGFPL